MSRIPAVLAVIGVAVALAGCARAPEPGPAERGQEIYDRVVEIGGNQEACSNCHRLDSGQTSGPSFLGLGARAEERTPDLSAEEYLRQSIVDPSATIVEGSFIFEMPSGYREVLTDEEITDLIAYMLAQ